MPRRASGAWKAGVPLMRALFLLSLMTLQGREGRGAGVG